MKINKSLSLTLFIHSFAGWVYIANNAVHHPETLSWGLTHFAPYPREDTFGIICFAVSLVSLFVWSMAKDSK
jgi:hypothetical protein